MVAVKQFSLSALLWLGLASHGLALGIDETTNDLTLVERKLKTPHSGASIWKNRRGLKTRSFKNIIDKSKFVKVERDVIGDFDELYNRDFDLDSRSFRNTIDKIKFVKVGRDVIGDFDERYEPDSDLDARSFKNTIDKSKFVKAKH